MDAIEKTIGKRPKGFVHPAADFSENTWTSLRNLTSSMTAT
jgi:hypothetical protein